MLDFTLKGQIELKKPMESYMKNHFSFLGVKAPDRKLQSKELIKESKKLPLNQLLKMVETLYQKEEREYQYVAIDCCVANVKRFSFTEIQHIASFVQQKSWWDSVDAWRKVFGDYVTFHPDEKEKVFTLFYQHPDFWMRRVSILLQLLEKETMNESMLAKAILYDQHTKEFFIQKAIGWALRNYGKYRPEWVTAFLLENSLSKLAEREASIYLVKENNFSK